MDPIFLVTILCTIFNQLYAQEIFDTVEAVVGRSAELPCNVTAELENDKLNILAWYMNGSSTAFYSRDLRGGDESPSLPGGRFRLVTGDPDGLDKLQIVAVRPSDAGVYQCLADFAASPSHKTFVLLNVIEPPRHLWVIHENGTQVAKASAGVNISQNIGPYYVGDTVHLFCVAFGGKPQASLSWWSEQHMLKDTYTPLSEHRVRSDLMYGPLRSEDHGRVITCFAKNNDKTTPLSIDIVVDMYLPPELVSLRSDGHENGRVRAGEKLNLQCRVLGARPPPPILWRLGDAHLHSLEQNVTSEPSQRLVASDIQLTVRQEYDESSLSCCAPAYTRGDKQDVCSEKLPLSVLYPPVLQIVVEEDLVDNNTMIVRKGSNIRMACSFQANPAVYQLIWFHEDDILTPSKDGNDVVQPFLEIADISESDSGEYVCAATNDEGSTYSEPININITYSSYCEEAGVIEYGVAENESINITCNVKASPEPTSYRWVIASDAINITDLKRHPHSNVETEDNVLLFERENSTYSTIFCWGINDVPVKGLSKTPCTFLVTDETKPRPPTDCKAVKNTDKDISVKCEKGHDGGLPQKFKFTVKSDNSKDDVLSITNLEPEFMITEPKQEEYKFIIIAFNDKGDSQTVQIEKDEIIDESEVSEFPSSAVSNIATLSLALFGGVLLVALAACGLVLCAHDRGSRLDLPRAHSDPPLCAYNTEESNCDTYHGSEDGSDCNVRRTESFRRAVSKYPSKNFDVRRTSSFHSARYMNDMEPEARCTDMIRHSNHCRVHSLQNISRKREMDALCDHLVLHLPPEANYNVPKPMNTFYTMPRKSRQKIAKELSDEVSEITQTSDGFSLPPPPDEFGTYRAGTRIKDIPKTTPTYTTIKRNNSEGKEPTRQQYSNAMNTVGIPTISGAPNTLYTYPDDDHRHQASHLSGGVISYPRESRF